MSLMLGSVLKHIILYFNSCVAVIAHRILLSVIPICYVTKHQLFRYFAVVFICSIDVRVIYLLYLAAYTKNIGKFI